MRVVTMKHTITRCLAMVLGGCTSLPTEESTAAPPMPGDSEVPVAAAPTPSEPVPTGEPVPSEGLHVIARAGASLQLHPLVDGTLLVSAGPQVLRVDARGELVNDPAMLRGIESIRPWVSMEDDAFEGVEAWGPVALGGRWPDAVYMSLDVASGFRSEGGEPVVYRHTPNGWTKLDTRSKHYSHYPAELHPWIEGSILARRIYQPWYPGQDEWQGEDGGPTRQQAAAAERAIRAAKPLVVIRGTPKAPTVADTVLAFDSRSTGEIFAVTRLDPATLVRLDAAGASHTVALPGPPYGVHAVVSDGPDSAWVFGSMQATDQGTEKPWLVRVEGERATLAPVPACTIKGLASFVATDDGTQWATCGESPENPYVYDEHELWRRPAEGTWERQRLPAEHDTPRRVVVHGGEVWVVASGKGGDALLSSRPRSTVLELPGLPAIGRQVIEWNDPLPVTDTCLYPYVPLRSPPAEAATVKAALDQRLRSLEHSAMSIMLVQTTIRGQAQLGLQLNMPEDHRDAKKVAAAARAALGNGMVDEPRCWAAKESEDGGLATWEGRKPL